MTSGVIKEDQAAFLVSIEHAIQHLCPWRHESRVRTKSGRLKWIRGSSLPKKQPDGSILWSCILTDISELMELRLLQEQHRQYSNHLVEAVEQERLRIARELHDAIGQALILHAFDIINIKQSLSPDCSPLQKCLDAMYDRAQQMVETVQKICTSLRPSLLDELGLVAAIDWLTEDFSRRSGIHSSVHWDSSPCKQLTCSTALFRIVQESLTNIGKHANASKVVIRFSRRKDQVRLKIQDNGCGFTPSTDETYKGFGIIGMKERAEALGATLEIRSEPQRGCSVIFSVICNKEVCYALSDH